MITIQGSESISAVENYLNQLRANPQNTDLKLPTKLKDDKLGGKAALMQFIIAWTRRNRKGRLVTHIQNLGDAQLQLSNLLNEDHGLLALVLAPSVVTLRGSSVVDVLSPRLDDVYSGVYQRPRFRGASAFFLIADHRSDVAIDSFYDRLCVLDEMRAERKRSFISEINNAIAQCIVRVHAEPLTAEQRKSAGEIIYELFTNTERWAQHTIDNRPLDPRARGILLNVHTDPVAFRKAAEDSPPIERYLDAILPLLGKRPAFLEVSVFDSGVGLAERMSAAAIPDGLSVEQERKAVIDCLLKHGTSSRDPTEGVGLYHILKLLTKRRGFMRYRGGRLSLFRNFLEHPYLPEKYDSPTVRVTGRSAAIDSPLRRSLAFLVDWACGGLEATRMTKTEGALFTFLVPLETLSEKPIQLDLLQPR